MVSNETINNIKSIKMNVLVYRKRSNEESVELLYIYSALKYHQHFSVLSSYNATYDNLIMSYLKNTSILNCFLSIRFKMNMWVPSYADLFLGGSGTCCGDLKNASFPWMLLADINSSTSKRLNKFIIDLSDSLISWG